MIDYTPAQLCQKEEKVKQGKQFEDRYHLTKNNSRFWKKGQYEQKKN